MRKIKFHLALFCFLAFLACKNNTENVEVTNKKTVVKNLFTVKVTLKSSVNDRFQFVFVDREKIETIVKVSVPKSDEYQTIVGSLFVDFEQEYPVTAYLGLGYFNLKNVKIKDVELNFNEKNEVFSATEFKEYFSVNKYVVNDTIQGNYQTIRIDNRHVPIFNIGKFALNSVKKVDLDPVK